MDVITGGGDTSLSIKTPPPVTQTLGKKLEDVTGAGRSDSNVIPFDRGKPLTAGGGTVTTNSNSNNSSTTHAHIIVNAVPGMDAEEVARQVRAQLDERDRDIKSDQRNAMYSNEEFAMP